MKYVIKCRFGEFLIRLCIEITFIFGVRADIFCYYVQKNCLFWASCRNISVHSGPGTRGYLDSRAGPFLGYVKKYCCFGDIFTSDLCTDIWKTIFVILEVQFHHEGGLSETCYLELFSRHGLYFHHAKNQPPLGPPSTFSEH